MKGAAPVMSSKTATLRNGSLRRASGRHADRADPHAGDDALTVSSVRRKAADDGGIAMRDSVDRYLDDLGGTSRITPDEEIELADTFLAAAGECLAIARDAGIDVNADGAAGERDAVIRNVTRLWRLLDEHDDASADSRRVSMVRMVEEELGCDGSTLRTVRREIAAARERALWARETMTQGNLALVVYVAKAYRNRGVPMADLIQEGNISLLRAVEKFDPDRGARLGTYATTWLHRSMRRTVRSLSRTVRLPESARDAQSHSVPIDEPSGEGRLSLTDVLAEDDAVAPDDVAAREQIRRRARQHLSSLSPHEELVVRRRFGIEHPKAETLREIGEELGVTRERARQIEKSALDKLRRRMRPRRR